MTRALWILSLLALLAMPAAGQMPDSALGTPLVAPELPAGTVTVRLVRGTASEPIVGVPVTLAAEGKPDPARTARTNNEGRAEFKDLAKGSRWIAAATVDDKELASQVIVVPDQGGMRVILSPIPLQMPAAAAPGAGGEPPMSPKQMRARPRGERTLPPGTLQLRVVRGEWKNPVVDHVIHLVGLAGTGEVVHEEGKTGADGRLSFRKLRPDVTWYPLSILPRGEVDDRMAGGGVTMPPRVGIAMALAGEAVDSGAPPLDDLAEFVSTQGAGPGEVLVRVHGSEEQLAEVEQIELVDALSGEVLHRAAAQPARRAAGGKFLPITPKADWPDGRVVVGVLRGDERQPQAVEGMPVQLVPEQGAPIERTTDGNGAAIFEGLQPGATYKPVLVIFDERVEGEAFQVPEKNGLVVVAFADWENPVKAAEIHALPGGNDRVYLARVQAGGRTQLSVPFQLTRQLGAVVPLELTPPPAFEFHMAGNIDDERMVFQVQLAMSNGPASPYTPPGGRMHIPLPRGFSNASVEEAWTERVKVDSEGLVWKGAIPPGGFQFNASFALPIEDGTFTLDLDVPLGATSSSIVLEHRAGMVVSTLGKSRGRTVSEQGRRFYVINGIEVGPSQSLVMKVTGLPQPPRWRTLVRNGVGIGVLLLLALGVIAVVVRRDRTTADPAATEREKLLEQLVDLERKFAAGGVAEAKYRKQRGRLTQRLEVLFDAPKGEGKAPDQSPEA